MAVKSEKTYWSEGNPNINPAQPMTGGYCLVLLDVRGNPGPHWAQSKRLEYQTSK